MTGFCGDGGKCPGPRLHDLKERNGRGNIKLTTGAPLPRNILGLSNSEVHGPKTFLVFAHFKHLFPNYKSIEIRWKNTKLLSPEPIQRLNLWEGEETLKMKYKFTLFISYSSCIAALHAVSVPQQTQRRRNGRKASYRRPRGSRQS